MQRNFNTPSKQLFVGNIDQAVSQDMLWAIFAQFGEIHRIKRFSDRGYAFIIFRNLNDAIWAREQLSIYPPVIHNRVLDINFGRLRVGRLYAFTAFTFAHRIRVSHSGQRHWQQTSGVDRTQSADGSLEPADSDGVEYGGGANLLLLSGSGTIGLT